MKKLALLAVLAMPLLGGCAYSGGAYAGYDPYYDSGYQGYERPASYYGQSEDYGRPYGAAGEAGYGGYGYGQQAYYGGGAGYGYGYAQPQTSYFNYGYAQPQAYYQQSYAQPRGYYSTYYGCGC
jgi:hypothetical protein